MKRRIEEPDDKPPAALTSYRRWCADRGLVAYGHELAVAQYRVWERARREWAVAHGLGESQIGTVWNECDQPWDQSAI